MRHFPHLAGNYWIGITNKLCYVRLQNIENLNLTIVGGGNKMFKSETKTKLENISLILSYTFTWRGGYWIYGGLDKNSHTFESCFEVQIER